MENNYNVTYFKVAKKYFTISDISDCLLGVKLIVHSLNREFSEKAERPKNTRKGGQKSPFPANAHFLRIDKNYFEGLSVTAHSLL